MNGLKYLCFVFTFMCSLVHADCFDKDTALVNKLRAKNIKIIVLYNFESTNNVLNIVAANRSPYYCLTANGLANIQKDIPLFLVQNISRICTAPSFRTQQTTNLLGAAFNLHALNLVVDPRLGMQNFGDFEGTNYNVYKESFGSEEDMLQGTPPNGESGCAVFQRTDDFLNSLLVYKNQTILIVSHAFNYCHICKVLTGEFPPIPTPGKFHIYDFTSP